jgi:hypothetical protein
MWSYGAGEKYMYGFCGEPDRKRTLKELDVEGRMILKNISN